MGCVEPLCRILRGPNIVPVMVMSPLLGVGPEGREALRTHAIELLTWLAQLCGGTGRAVREHLWA